MNTSNQNYDTTAPNDLPDRLVDLALSELVGGNAPPDLSSRITTAASRQMPTIMRVPKSLANSIVWVSLAVAVTLLIAATVVLLPRVQSGRQIVAMKDRLGNQHDASQLFPTAATPPGASSIATNGTTKSTDLDAATLLQSSGSGGESAKPASNLSLQLDRIVGAGKALPQVASTSPRRRSAEMGSRPVEHYINDSAAVPGLRPAEPYFKGVNSGPVPTSAPARIADGRAVALQSNRVTKTESVAGTGPESSGYKYGPGSTPTTTQLVDDIHELQRQGKPSKKLVKELERRLDKSVDLSAQTEGIGPDASGDRYTQIVENPFIKAEGGAAVSTFSIDVDTASYSNVRQFLLDMHQLPPPDAVRIEELINYFHYDYEGPKQSDEAPFAAHVEVTACPWAPEHRLARIGIKGREMDRNKRPQSNLVFLVDVSGSMNEPAKLPLVVYGLEQLTRELGENDHIAIVVYAGTEGLVLPSTSGSKQDTILAALAKLQAGGSTAGGAGIQLAYQIAEDNFIKGGTNRVILCTDGDFNVGVTNTADLQRLVEQKAKDTGVFISTLGFGRGNLNDAMMVAISDHGNGNYHYIDNRTEARRVLVEEMTGTLVTIAKDVKIQVEFNPNQVAGYRLIGYEKRMLRTEDFNDDKKDAGEIGAGHTVTALYEVVPANKNVDVNSIDPLKYQQPATEVAGSNVRPSPNTSKELLTLKMRYKAPDGDTSKKLEWPITDDGKSFAAASPDTKFAASVAAFGLLLRDSQYKGNLTYAAVQELAQGGIGDDPHGYRKEFVAMVSKAKELRHE
jgi:Ca-activated chloride channel family protein